MRLAPSWGRLRKNFCMKKVVKVVRDAFINHILQR